MKRALQILEIIEQYPHWLDRPDHRAMIERMMDATHAQEVGV